MPIIRRFGPVPAERAIHLLRQVCHSLSEAESRGLIHRDIKPSNIFVCRYGDTRNTAVCPDRAADTRSTRSTRAVVPRKGPGRPAAIRQGTVLTLSEIEGAVKWTEDRAFDWWATHRPVPQQERFPPLQAEL